MPPPVPQLPVPQPRAHLPNQPSDYSRTSNWPAISAAPRLPVPQVPASRVPAARLLQQRSTPALRNKASRNNLRPIFSVQGLHKIIEDCVENKRHTADEIFNQLTGATRTAQEQDIDRREGTVLNKQFFDCAIDASNDTTMSKQPETQNAPAVPAMPSMPTMCDLTNLIGFKISLLVRIIKLTT